MEFALIISLTVVNMINLQNYAKNVLLSNNLKKS